MEPTDQPPPTPQTWAETSAWASAPEPSAAPEAPPEPAAWTPPPNRPPMPGDYLPPAAGPVPARPSRPVRASRGWSGTRWMVLWALLAEIVVIAVGCNQWVTRKAVHYSGLVPQPGFAHQFVYSTQAYAWRLTKATGETTSEWAAPLVRVAVVLVLSAALIALVLRTGSFWRAAIASVLVVVFATQVAAVIANLVSSGPEFRRYVDYLPTGGNGVFYGVYTSTDGAPSGAAGGRVTVALFGSANGYDLVGSVILGVLVGIVVGIVARRFDDGASGGAPAALWPSHQFFPPGEMQRTYEASTSVPPPLASPGSFATKPDDDDLGGGRHSRD